MKTLECWPKFNRTSLLAIALAFLSGAAVAVAVQGTTVSAASQPAGPQIQWQQNFEAMGLPAGAAVGTAARITLPAGFNFKHAHGGPEYVYVISGSFTVSHAEGATTYNAGDFATVPGGMIHTATTTDAAEIFVLNLRSVGADWIIPVL